MIPPPHSAVSPERTLQTAMLRVGLGSSSAVDACYAAVPRYATLTHDKKGILVDGFELRKYREYETFTVWKCLRNRRTCRCIIKTANSTLEILSTNKAHNHDAQAGTAVTYDVSESSQWEIFVTRREKRSLRVDNFVYYRIKEDEDTVYWKCSNNKCNARAQSDHCLSNKKIINGSHNHPPRSEDFFMSAKISHGVKRRISLDASERPQKAVDLTIENIPTESLCGTDIRQFTFIAKRKKL